MTAHFHPFIKTKQTTGVVMRDVVLALLPIALIAYLAFGDRALTVMGAAVLSCLLADLLFSWLFLEKVTFVKDGSAVVTGLLLAFTLSPLTPWYVVAFGGVMAVLFGKILWGGVGKNRFNPALVGRECMVVFYPLVMNGPDIWKVGFYAEPHWFDSGTGALSEHFNNLLYQPSGALGEYSVFFLVLGGLYLILRRRISWHIPVAALGTFYLLQWLVPAAANLTYSLGGLLLGTIYMATDMPSSPTHNKGKVYYGVMLGVVLLMLLLGGVRFAYMSYGILLMNGFSSLISKHLRPAAWGRQLSRKEQAEKIVLLTIYILGAALAVISLEYYQLSTYLVYVYILFLIWKYQNFYQHKITNPV